MSEETTARLASGFNPFSADLDRRQILARLAAVGVAVSCSGGAIVTNLVADDSLDSKRLTWSSRVIQQKVLRTRSDAGIPTHISLRKHSDEMAVVGDDHIVRIQQRQTGELKNVLESHSDWIKKAVFHPNGKQLISAGADRRIVVWNADNHHDYHRFATEDHAISGLAISPNGQRLATVGFSNEVRLYDFETRHVLHKVIGPDADLRAVDFSEDSTQLAVGGRSGIVRIIDVETGRKIRDIALHKKRIRQLIYIDSSQSLLTVSDDGTARTVVVATGKQNTVLTAPAKFYSLALIDNDRIAVGSSDNRIRIVDFRRGELIGHLAGHSGTVCCLAVDKNQLFSGSFDTQIRIWEIDGNFVKSDTPRFGSKPRESKSETQENNNAGTQPKPSITPPQTSSLQPGGFRPVSKGGGFQIRK